MNFLSFIFVRGKKCEHVKNRLKRAKEVLKSFNLEVRGLERADAKPYEEVAPLAERSIA